MDWLTAVFLGIVQGTTEWLPISSSGQSTLFLVNGLGISAETAISLGLAVHVGTALAVVAKYPHHLIRMADPRNGNVSRFYWYTTIISLLVAFPLILLLNETFENNLWSGTTISLFIGIALVCTGLILGRASGSRTKSLSSGDLRDFLLLGVAQGFAILPGISRSGMTVSTLLIRGYKKTSGLKFSFLLSVPVSFAASGYFLLFGDLGDVGLNFFVITGILAFAFGYLTIDMLIRVSKTINFSKFCVLFGGIAIAIALLLLLI